MVAFSPTTAQVEGVPLRAWIRESVFGVSYSPIIDLVLGLFLMLVPVILLAVLAWLLVTHEVKQNPTPPTGDRPRDWEGWVRETLEEARAWRSSLEGSSADSLHPHSPENLTQIIGLLEGMKNGKPDRPLAEKPEE